VEPVAANDICCFPGPAATRCPGYCRGPAPVVPDHLSFIPIFGATGGEPGCAHVVAQRTSRGGFRAGCGHPAGSPVHWAEPTLLGRPVRLPHRPAPIAP
jgi:hypothetical protein